MLNFSMLPSHLLITLLIISTVKCQEGGVSTVLTAEIKRLATEVCANFNTKQEKIIGELTAQFKATIVELKQEFSLKYDMLARKYEESKVSIQKLEQIIESQPRQTSMVSAENSLTIANKTIFDVAATDMLRDTALNRKKGRDTEFNEKKRRDTEFNEKKRRDTFKGKRRRDTEFNGEKRRDTEFNGERRRDIEFHGKRRRDRPTEFNEKKRRDTEFNEKKRRDSDFNEEKRRDTEFNKKKRRDTEFNGEKRRDAEFNGEKHSNNTMMTDDSAENSGHMRKSAHARNVQTLATNSAFSLYLSHALSLSHNRILKFDGVVLNLGNDYNPTTGIYTVPVTGIYVFHFYIETYTNKEPFAYLMVDGRLQSTVFVNGQGSQTLSGGNTVVIHLQAGESVWIENRYDDRDYFGSSEHRLTTFSGYFLR